QINQIGEIIAVEKVRKLEKTLTTMGKIVEKLAANQPAFIYLTDTGHHESTEFFKKILATHFGWHDLPVIRVSTISLANHGLMGTGIGVFYGELPHIVKALKKLPVLI
ncbi:MAG: fatty acid-binding protein DegV, partial [Moraxella sp.]